MTLTEVLRGGPRDTAVHRALSLITVVPVSPELGRHAGELLGATGLAGKRCSVDAVVAATALERERPVVLLTSDPDDLSRLVEEPQRPKAQRITVVHALGIRLPVRHPAAGAVGPAVSGGGYGCAVAFTPRCGPGVRGSRGCRSR